MRTTSDVQNLLSKETKRPLEIIYHPRTSLVLDPINHRIHSKKQILQIAKSIEEFGFNVPILIDAKKHIIAGHGRVAACAELGWHDVPTICLDHLSKVQAKAFLIADNKLTENAQWDEKLLARNLKELSDLNLDFSLDVTGFEIGEIDLMIEGLSKS